MQFEISIQKAIDKEFQIDDTAIATRQITSKLDQLEKMVKKGPPRHYKFNK